MTRPGGAALDPETGEVLDWDPEIGAVLLAITDHEVILGGEFDFAGPIPTKNVVRVPPAPPRHSQRPGSNADVAFRLSRPAPNPVRGEALIGYELASAARVSLDLYDTSGRRLQTVLENEQQAAGAHALALITSSLSPGLYYCRLKVGDRSQSRAMVVVH